MPYSNVVNPNGNSFERGFAAFGDALRQRRQLAAALQSLQGISEQAFNPETADLETIKRQQELARMISTIDPKKAAPFVSLLENRMALASTPESQAAREMAKKLAAQSIQEKSNLKDRAIVREIENLKKTGTEPSDWDLDTLEEKQSFLAHADMNRLQTNELRQKLAEQSRIQKKLADAKKNSITAYRSEGYGQEPEDDDYKRLQNEAGEDFYSPHIAPLRAEALSRARIKQAEKEAAGLQGRSEANLAWKTKHAEAQNEFEVKLEGLKQANKLARDGKLTEAQKERLLLDYQEELSKQKGLAVKAKSEGVDSGDFYRNAVDVQSAMMEFKERHKDQAPASTSSKAVTSEKIRVISPSGVPGMIPAEQLDTALQQGYKRAK